jgi:hypothetical protein
MLARVIQHLGYAVAVRCWSIHVGALRGTPKGSSTTTSIIKHAEEQAKP